eukprot:758761-Hanusia_phi.AAC.1
MRADVLLRDEAALIAPTRWNCNVMRWDGVGGRGRGNELDGRQSTEGSRSEASRKSRRNKWKRKTVRNCWRLGALEWIERCR